MPTETTVAGSSRHDNARPGHVDVAALPVPVSGTLQVDPWTDPYLAEHGHDVRSSYVELFWLPILGPTATMLLRRLAIGLEHSPGGYRLPVVDTARSLGLGAPTTRQSPFVRALHRCVIYRCARFTDTGLEVHPRMPSLHAGQLRRLPGSLRAAHGAVAARHPVRAVAADPSGVAAGQ